MESQTGRASTVREGATHVRNEPHNQWLLASWFRGVRGRNVANPHDQGPSSRRWIAAAEFLLGASVVIGHNLFRIVPNEVPILTGLFLVSNRLWTGRWRVAGLGSPPSWRRTVGIAIAAAVLRLALGEFVIEPLGSRFGPPPAAPEAAAAIAGNTGHAALALLIVWVFAALGEEFAYRGYLLSRAATVGGGSSVAYWVGVVFAAVLFGLGHYYKGPVGVVDSAVAGLILGTAYMLSGRNLWAAVLAHGLIDTYGVVVLYFGWAS
jgi:membrane protease YdiL (CAAX protease family)